VGPARRGAPTSAPPPSTPALARTSRETHVGPTPTRHTPTPPNNCGALDVVVDWVMVVVMVSHSSLSVLGKIFGVKSSRSPPPFIEGRRTIAKNTK